MNRKQKLTVVTASAVVTAAAAAAVCSAEMMFRAAAARQQPALTRKRPKAPEKLDDLSRQKLEAMARLEQWEGETVQIVSRDGLTLKGHWFPAEHAKRTLLMVHGWRSSWSRDFGICAEYFHQQGCNLLLIEQRGHGASDGDYIGFGVLERFDCISWLDYLRARWGEQLPIYLYGISMGAATVLMASGLKLPPCVKGIIADCGYTSPAAIRDHVLRKTGKHLRALVVRMAGRISRRRAGYGMEDYSTLEALKRNRTPVLFIHGSADRFVPMEMTVENYNACRAPRSILIVDGAPHAKSYLVAPEQYQAAAQKFFSRCEAE